MVEKKLEEILVSLVDFEILISDREVLQLRSGRLGWWLVLVGCENQIFGLLAR
jgi:hypothetical protein